MNITIRIGCTDPLNCLEDQLTLILFWSVLSNFLLFIGLKECFIRESPRHVHFNLVPIGGRKFCIEVQEHALIVSTRSSERVIEEALSTRHLKPDVITVRSAQALTSLAELVKVSSLINRCNTGFHTIGGCQQRGFENFALFKSHFLASSSSKLALIKPRLF